MPMVEVEDNPLLPPTIVDGYDVDQIPSRKPGFWTITDLGYKKSQLPIYYFLLTLYQKNQNLQFIGVYHYQGYKLFIIRN